MFLTSPAAEKNKLFLRCMIKNFKVNLKPKVHLQQENGLCLSNQNKELQSFISDIPVNTPTIGGYTHEINDKFRISHIKMAGLWEVFCLK